jgi:hypothetical protein
VATLTCVSDGDELMSIEEKRTTRLSFASTFIS